MHFLITLLLVVAVHLSLHVEAWLQVGLLADDRHMVGGAVLRHQGLWSFASMFVPEAPPGAATALYRPFLDLGFWLEQPWFGADATGYHVVNSLMHCGTAMLWFVLVRRLSGSVAAALATAVLFAGWPGHSEALHWVAARVNVQSTFFVSLALVVLDTALLRQGRAARAMLLTWAVVVGVVAVGSKESGVFVVPLAAIVCWQRAEGGGARRVLAALRTWAPMGLGVAGWLWWRASQLGTWGSGTHYGWQLQRVDTTTCWNWLTVLFAPVHRGFTAFFWTPVLWALHLVLLGVLLLALRNGAVRRAAACGGALVVMGYVAGIGLEPLDVDVLENVRYGYEPALGTCVLFGLAIATLPVRSRGAVLAGLVLVHALVLDGNRQSWLRAGALYQRLENDIVDVARATQQPVRVLQAPGVYEGAFALLNGFTEFQFMQAFAPPGTNLRGAVSSTQEWPAVLHELGAAAVAQQAPTNTFTVQWDDGALVPFTLDGRWPHEPWPGTRIDYAWIARTRPFVRSSLPVHVLVQSTQPIELQVRAHAIDRRWSGPVRIQPASTDATPVALSLPLPADLAASVAVEVELIVRGADRERRYSLGVTVPVAR